MTTAQEVKATIEKAYGKGAIVELGEPPRAFPALSSGVAGLDAALGGGWTRSGVVELYGADVDAAMDRLLFRTIVATQRGGGAVAYIDAEHWLDLGEARRLGVDVGRMLVSQPDSGEQALEIAETLVRSGAVELVVIDAVGSLLPVAAIAGDAVGSGEEPLLGHTARMFSQGLRKISGVAERTHTLVLFVNRLRPRPFLGTPSPQTYADARNSLKFYAKQRVELGRADGGVTAHVRKNKLAAPFKSALVEPAPEELGLVAGADVQVRLTSIEVAHGPATPSTPRFWFPGYRLVRVVGDRAELEPHKPGALTISVPLCDVRIGGRPLETA
jgi:recombination protein RecA